MQSNLTVYHKQLVHSTRCHQQYLSIDNLATVKEQQLQQDQHGVNTGHEDVQPMGSGQQLGK